LYEFPHTDKKIVAQDSFADESLFLISTSDPWYGDIIIYLQNKKLRLELSKIDCHRIQYQSQQYNNVGDTLYRRGTNSIFQRCLTLQGAEKALNDCHSRARGNRMSVYATAQRYYVPVIFRLQCLKIALLQFANAIIAKCTITKCEHL